MKQELKPPQPPFLELLFYGRVFVEFKMASVLTFSIFFWGGEGGGVVIWVTDFSKLILFANKRTLL